jgi:hypothetical protein
MNENELPPAIPHRPDETLDEWCHRRRWTRAKWYEETMRGIAPIGLRTPGSNRVTITARADWEWEQRMRALANSQEMRAEAERRSEQRRAAVRVAVQNGNHVSAQKRRAREARAASSKPQMARPRWKPSSE